MGSEDVYQKKKQIDLHEALLNDSQLNELKNLSFEIHNKYMTLKALIIDGKVVNIENSLLDELKEYMKQVYILMDLRIEQIKLNYK